jgi:hypothetical protein
MFLSLLLTDSLAPITPLTLWTLFVARKCLMNRRGPFTDSFFGLDVVNRSIQRRRIIQSTRPVEYYKAFLTKNLFDDLAWRYMIAALKPSELNLQYKKDILKIEEKNRTWDKVEECVHDIFKLSIMQGEIQDS